MTFVKSLSKNIDKATQENDVCQIFDSKNYTFSLNPGRNELCERRPGNNINMIIES